MRVNRVVRGGAVSTRATALFAVIAAFALLLGGIPTAVTGAYLTASATASSAAAVGNWCGVPDSATNANVYPLNTFTSVTASGTTSRMMIVPVLNNGDFDASSAATGADGQLGVRLWSCTPTALTGTVKATAWRGVGTAANVSGYSTSMAQARVNPAASGLGAELRDLHRAATSTTTKDTTSGMNVTSSRYTWLLDSTRTSGADFASVPACADRTCAVAPSKTGTSFANAFSGTESATTANAVQGNSATYLGGTYYPKNGAWPTTSRTLTQTEINKCNYFLSWLFNPSECSWSQRWAPGSTTTTTTVQVDNDPVVYPKVLTATNTATAAQRTAALNDTTGDVVQWVVLEWTGSTIPATDMEIEVYVK